MIFFSYAPAAVCAGAASDPYRRGIAYLTQGQLNWSLNCSVGKQISIILHNRSELWQKRASKLGKKYGKSKCNPGGPRKT